MFHFGFGPDTLVPLMALSIPIVAIIGGITAGIVRTLGQQRLIELAQRERIVALEKGIDPSKLPPLPVPGGFDDIASSYMTPRQAALRRAQGLLVGGLVTLAVGIGLGIMLFYLGDENNVWSVGLIPALVGVALLVSSMIVRNSAPDDSAPPTRHP